MNTKRYIQDYREFHNSPVKRIEVTWDKKQENWRWTMGEVDMMGDSGFGISFTFAEGRCEGRLPGIAAARKAARDWIAEEA